MRLFLIGWAEDRPELVDVADEMKRHGHDILYWTRSTAVFTIDEKHFPYTVFHDYEDAVTGRPARALAGEVFDPPSAELLGQMHDAESIFLTMANKKYDWMTVDERKHLYYHMVGVWTNILNKFKPEAIVFTMIPHTLYNYVLFKLAKLRHVPTIMLDTTLVKDRLLFMNDYESGNRKLIHELKETEGKLFSISDLSPDLQDYFNQHCNSPSADSAPPYIKKELSNYSFKKKFILKFKILRKSLRERTFFVQTVGYLYKKFHHNLDDEYKSVQIMPDFDKKFVYAPLQYQPECTTSPLGGIFVDQILMLETLSAGLPKDWVIYVKEHPIQWLSRGKNFVGARYRGYYETIAKIKNVIVVPISVDSFSLMRKAQAVATVTGTTGWEAVLRGKPALIFGFPWYQHCPGVFRATSIESCHEFFLRAEEHPKIDLSQVINFFYAFDRASIHGFVDAYGRENSPLSSEENKYNITQALLTEIDQIR
ncbi:MAG: hypothetical protein UX10_C0006G0005 [Candidatus Magasanikbacteria bacterium GW2011_GWA2_45_39]|uniref:Capsule polysaccharide biosynthesis protein n=1 Tax=Candidatus Magasanikbacteria bacterium GW2011_GWA2_45_39 TaxID=1619041 RepID=A0A0G1MHQ5_9BACT|nr:MAG: hypothetical protein UX10_C0006G0005 [Candidatus Magasanikbacteria bacterium GW2011_GWA2_45_39]